jgi:hypothetical protein
MAVGAESLMVGWFVVVVGSINVMHVQLTNIFRDEFAPLTDFLSETEMFSLSIV